MSGHRLHPSGSVCNVFQSPKRVQSSGNWKRLVAAVDGVTHVVRFTMVPCRWNFFPSPPSLLSLKSMHVQPKFRICPPIYLFFQSFSWSLFVLDNFFFNFIYLVLILLILVFFFFFYLFLDLFFIFIFSLISLIFYPILVLILLIVYFIIFLNFFQ
jgi:hypothetical protein